MGNRGYATAQGWVLEASFGAGGSATNWCHSFSSGLQEKPRWEAFGTLYEGAHGDVNEDFIVSKVTEGTVTMGLQYRYQGHWWALIMGAPPTTTGSAPSTHTFQRDQSFAESLAVVTLRGNVDEWDLSAGVRVASAKVTIPEKGVCRLEVNCLGRETTRTVGSRPTPSFSAEPPEVVAYAKDITAITGGSKEAEFAWGSNPHPFNSVTIDINNQLSDNGAVSVDYYPADITPSAQGEVLVTLNVPYRDGTTQPFRDGNRDRTENTFSLTLAGTGNNQIVFTSPRATVIRYEDPITNPGRQTASITLRLKPSGPTGALTVAITNDDASYDAN